MSDTLSPEWPFGSVRVEKWFPEERRHLEQKLSVFIALVNFPDRRTTKKEKFRRGY